MDQFGITGNKPYIIKTDLKKICLKQLYNFYTAVFYEK
jgi:hypothetical protein